MRRALVIACVTAGCGGPPAPRSPALAAPPRPAPVSSTSGFGVEIVNDGALYSTIDETDCLTWPSAEMKARGGSRSWDRVGLEPTDGMRGVLVGESLHCDGDTRVLFVEIAGQIVPIGASGVRTLAGTEVPPRLALRAAAGGAGQERIIIDTASIYPALGRTACGTWPSPELATRADAATWRRDGFRPVAGDRGRVVGLVQHCQHGRAIYLLEVDDQIVAIDVDGTRPAD
ncbi:MAG: hypothetical protein R2939_06955 [Kofleriaceae bacterium]